MPDLFAAMAANATHFLTSVAEFLWDPIPQAFWGLSFVVFAGYLLKTFFLR